MAKFCTECGREIADGIAFCTECGAPAPKDNAAKVNAPETKIAPEPKLVPEQKENPPELKNASEPKKAPDQQLYTPEKRIYTSERQPDAPTTASPAYASVKAVGTGAFFWLMFLFARAMLIWTIIGIIMSIAAYFALRWLYESLTD